MDKTRGEGEEILPRENKGTKGEKEKRTLVGRDDVDKRRETRTKGLYTHFTSPASSSSYP